MTPRIPNLFPTEKDAERLYELYLCRLQANGRQERIIAASRTIRRHAAATVGVTEALFTFDWEIRALSRLTQYEMAWRQLRLRERLIYGEPHDLLRQNWEGWAAYDLLRYYAPLLYLLQRYRLGCSLMQAALTYYRRWKSYDLLFHVYKPGVPQALHEVTLRHFYDKLGMSLKDWQQWSTFICGFPSKLFRLTGVDRDELLEDPWLLAVFFHELMLLRDERVTSGVTRGQADLVESPEKVRRFQEATHGELEEFRERIRPTEKRFDTMLNKLFPELRRLPK